MWYFLESALLRKYEKRKRETRFLNRKTHKAPKPDPQNPIRNRLKKKKKETWFKPFLLKEERKAA